MVIENSDRWKEKAMKLVQKLLGGQEVDGYGLRCYRCRKKLSSMSSGIYTGSGLASAALESPYACVSCGTAFCVDCMVTLRKGICPHCGQNIGW
jgi:hypothetical protein